MKVSSLRSQKTEIQTELSINSYDESRALSYGQSPLSSESVPQDRGNFSCDANLGVLVVPSSSVLLGRSEERRVGKEC